MNITRRVNGRKVRPKIAYDDASMHSPTLFILAALLMGLMGAVFQAVWRFNRDIPGLKWWTQAYAFGFLGCVGFLLRSHAPAPVSVLLTQGGILLMACLCWQGCRAHVGRPLMRWLPVCWFIGAWLLLALYFTVVQSDLRVRLVMASVGPGVLFLLSAHTMWPRDSQDHPARRLTAWVFGVHGVVLLLRPVLFHVGSGHIEAVSVAVLVESIVVLNMLGFCILMLVNEHVNAALRRLAETDSLTGVFNHRSFLAVLSKAMSVEARLNRHLPVMLVDLDHFKRVNDTWGHQTGDEALRHFVAVANACMRQGDVLGRLGGEEFAVFLPQASGDEAVAVAERLRARVEAHPLPTAHGPIPLSVSVGVAHCRPGERPETALGRADHAMYQAKAAGRNRVEVWRSDEPGAA